MPYSKLSTTKIAREVGCHPNTVRLYEAEGLIPRAPRSPKGYRLYTPEHLAQMQLAWLALHSPFPGRKLRSSLRNLTLIAAAGDLAAAYQAARTHLEAVRAELAQAEAAADEVSRWINRFSLDAHSRRSEPPHGLPAESLAIGQAAARLHVSRDMLRNWEANGLLRVPRDPATGYRRYGAAEIARLRIIRMLLTAGYSSMAILHMLLQLEAGDSANPRALLDAPDPDEDLVYVSDRWLTTLHDHELRARRLIEMLAIRLEEIQV